MNCIEGWTGFCRSVQEKLTANPWLEYEPRGTFEAFLSKYNADNPDLWTEILSTDEFKTDWECFDDLLKQIKNA